MSIDEVRALALALPGSAESPHFERTSFRVGGKIFATAPPDGQSMNIFVDELDARAAIDVDPAAFEEVRWGKRMVGVRVNLASADPAQVKELMELAWRIRAPAKLRRGRD
jgi:hypothetical protein